MLQYVTVSVAATELDHRVVTKETVAAEISLLASARIKGLRLSGCFTMLAVNFVSDGSFCGINNLLLCLKGLQKPEKSVFSTVWFYTCWHRALTVKLQGFWLKTLQLCSGSSPRASFFFFQHGFLWFLPLEETFNRCSKTVQWVARSFWLSGMASVCLNDLETNVCLCIVKWGKIANQILCCSLYTANILFSLLYG